jgi:hypothetical protein
MRVLQNVELCAVAGGEVQVTGGSDYAYGAELGGGGGGGITYESWPTVTVVGNSRSVGSPYADAVATTGLTISGSLGGAALAEGFAIGLGTGAALGPVGALIGGLIGVSIAYWLFK